MQPSYAQEMEVTNNGAYGAMISGLGDCIALFGSIPICFCCPNPYKRVDQGSVGLVTRFGKFYKAVDPGLVRVNPLSEDIRRVDVKIQVSEIPRQVVMTKDNVNVQIDSVIYYHIINPYKAAFSISNVSKAVIERTQTTLRHVVGGRVLQDTIENRETIAAEIEEIVAEPSKVWGIKVESILIKDIQFSRELQEALSSAAQAKRIGESKVIQARAEVESAKLMRQAADILASPAAMQIRALETYAAMAKTAGAKVIYLPAPHASSGLGNNAVGGSMNESDLRGDLSPQSAYVLDKMADN